jgi:tetratricopeptide (TPR) repeat protein
VEVFGHFTEYTRISDLGEKRTFHFCPECGATVFYTTEGAEDVVAVPIGTFADPSFPAPSVSVYESRRHSWVSLPTEIERNAPELWEPLRPLYEAGDYAEAANRGRELLEENPGYGDLFYNVACCESLAGRTDEALEHLGRALDTSESFRAMATEDADFDTIRNEPAFKNLIGH